MANASAHSTSTPDAGWFDQLVTAAAVLDADLRFVHVNPAFTDLFMAATRRLRDAPIEMLGSAAASLTALIERTRASDRPLTARAQLLPVTDMRVLHADVSLSPLPTGAVLLELHALAPDAGEHSLSGSLRGLAHEVKNPLAGMRGAAQLLRRRASEADQQRLADLIIAEADRLGALTDRLLHPAGKPHLSMVNLHEVAERARAVIALEAAPSVVLERDYDPSLPALRGDADRLQQVLLNLLRNAVQAQAQRISLRTRAEHGALIAGRGVRLALRVEVIDDGNGVPDSVRETLFAPLVSARADGTGLGLALAREIASEHGGELDFHSRPGRTVFSLLLPAESAHG
jgi:two-component system nitrogen regulation sensor histidine kinase GlnL